MQVPYEREIERSAQLLDAAVAKLDAVQATLGVMQSSLDKVTLQLSNEAIEFEDTLNWTLRIDFEAVSLRYASQRIAMQSAYQITSMMFQMSLMNYL